MKRRTLRTERSLRILQLAMKKRIPLKKRPNSLASRLTMMMVAIERDATKKTKRRMLLEENIRIIFQRLKRKGMLIVHT
jgi:hypothetical protein